MKYIHTSLHMPVKKGNTKPFKNETHFVIVLVTKSCSGDKIEKNEMDGACSACRGEQRGMQCFGGET